MKGSNQIDRLDPAAQRGLIEGFPMGRTGIPQDVGEAVAFLAAEGAGSISGIGLPIDGAS